MMNFETCEINNIVIHDIGTKYEDGKIRLSESCFLPDDMDVHNLLKSYFLSPFKRDAYYRFAPVEENLDNNLVYSIIHSVFEEDVYKRQIQQDPTKSDYYRAKGQLYEKINEPAKAEQMYIKTLELKPDDFFAQYNLGNIQLNRVIEAHKVDQDIVDVKEYNAEPVSYTHLDVYKRQV